MLKNKKIVVVLPAYNAEKTLSLVYREIPMDVVDEVILVDDCSSDKTVEIARELGIKFILQHDYNKGYGGNQKTCYQKALQLNADIVVMLHPDYQYTPKLIPSLCEPIALGIYDAMLGSRILSRGAREGGMPRYKYFSNRVLTFIQNLLMQQKLSEYHTGFRAFNRKVLETLPIHKNSDDFVFDNQMLAQLFYHQFSCGEISCPTKYFKEASSINFKRSIVYGLGVLWVSLSYFLQKRKLIKRSFLHR